VKQSINCNAKKEFRKLRKFKLYKLLKKLKKKRGKSESVFVIIYMTRRIHMYSKLLGMENNNKKEKKGCIENEYTKDFLLSTYQQNS